MIELMVRRYLAEALSVPVRMEMPEHPPDALVLVEKTGSSETDHIRRATLAVQSYAPSLAEAARLNEQVKEQLGRMPRRRAGFCRAGGQRLQLYGHKHETVPLSGGGGSRLLSMKRRKT